MQMCRRIRTSRDVGANYSAANPPKEKGGVEETLRQEKGKKSLQGTGEKRRRVCHRRRSEWMEGEGQEELEAKPARRRHDKCKKSRMRLRAYLRQGTGNMETKGE